MRVDPMVALRLRIIIVVAGPQSGLYRGDNLRQLRAWFVRLGGFFRRNRSEREFAAEMESHLQMHVEDNVRAGMSAAEAKREALIKLGGIEQTKEIYRDRRGLSLLETFFQDLRFSFRMLRKIPLYRRRPPYPRPWYRRDHGNLSVVYGVLLRPLPYTDSSRIMAVFEVNSKGGWSHLADPNFDDFCDQNRSFQAIAKYNYYMVSVSGLRSPRARQWHPSRPTFSRSSAFSQSSGGFQCRRREERGGAHHSCQLWILEAVSRIFAGPLAVALED